MSADLRRAEAFAQRLGLTLPLLMAPMAGVPAVALASAVGHAGGMAALGALLMPPQDITAWVQRYRQQTTAPLQINLWVPDPVPARDAAHEQRLCDFLSRFGPVVPQQAADARPLDFDLQCQAVLAERPAALSTIMGLLPSIWVQRCKAAGVPWWATVTSVAEARAAAAAGADVIVAQGAEAGGHRGAFDAAGARDRAVGLMALLPQVVDAVSLPVVATGGIADARGVAAALMLGASAVQLGTALLRCPEAALAPAWADGLAGLAPENSQLTRAFSGRWGRAIATDYVRAAAVPGAPDPAPYPVQRGLTALMRKVAEQAGDLQHMQAWAGQGAALARAEPAGPLLTALWAEASAKLGG